MLFVVNKTTITLNRFTHYILSSLTTVSHYRINLIRLRFICLRGDSYEQTCRLISCWYTSVIFAIVYLWFERLVWVKNNIFQKPDMWGYIDFFT